MSTEYVTSEYTISPRAGVWVMLSVISASVYGKPRPIRFEVTTSTKYRAILPACLFKPCLDGELTACTRALDSRGQHSGMSVDTWLRHIRTHCHRRHLAQAEKFQTEVGKTYRRRMLR